LTAEHVTHQWCTSFLGVLDSINRNAYPGPKLLDRAKTAGFINTHGEVIKVPLGPWPKDPRLKEIGMMNLVQTLDGLDASLKALMMLGYTEEEVTLMLARVRKELKSREFHSYIKL